MKTIVYILLSVAAIIGVIAAVLFITDDGKKRTEKLSQLEKAREAKAEKKILREIEEEYNSITNNESDASEKN